MIAWLKNHFIPHKGNKHTPRFLMGPNARRLVIVLVVCEFIFYLIPAFTFVGVVQNTGLADVLPAVLGTLTNEQRQSLHLAMLTESPLLTEAATEKAQDMATNSYFAHTSPEGKTPWYWLDKVGYNYDYAGENLAIDFSDSKDVTNAWMNSPTHRANIVKGEYTEFGTGIATGTYEGHSTVFVVQVFGNPAKADIPISQTVMQSDQQQITHLASNKPEIRQNSAHTKVLGAETTQVSSTQKTPTITETNANQTVTAQPNATILQEIVSSPRHIINVVLYGVVGLIFLAYLLMYFYQSKKKKNHPHTISNGLIIIAFVGAIFLINCWITTNAGVISSSIHYSKENKILSN